MSEELVELLGLLKDKNPVVRQLALENLLPSTQSGDPHVDLWKENNWQGGRILKVLARDINTPKTSEQAIAGLVNLSYRSEEFRNILIDAPFLTFLHSLITNKDYERADFPCMLLSNLGKNAKIEVLFGLKTGSVEGLTETSVLGQLMEVFVVGDGKKWNPHANFDFLGNVWGDVTQFPAGRKYLLTATPDAPDHYPFQSLLQFTSSSSVVRRAGTAIAIKNSCFETESHDLLLSPNKINLLPYLLLPLCTAEEFPDEDAEQLPAELQLLPGTHKREESNSIISTHLESLLLLTTTLSGREMMRKNGVYAVIRRLHEQVEDEDVKASVERLVNVIMREESKVEEVKDDQIEEGGQRCGVASSQLGAEPSVVSSLAVAAKGGDATNEMSSIAQQTLPGPFVSAAGPDPPATGESSTVRPGSTASSQPTASSTSTTGAKLSSPQGQYAEYKLTSLKHSSSIRNHVMKLHAPRAVDPFTATPPDGTETPNAWSHPLKLHRRDPSAAPIIHPSIDTADSDSKEDVKPAVDLSVIAPYGGAQKAKKDLFKPKTKQVFHADPQELQLRNEERLPWVLEDFDGKNTWVGTLEGGGASGYALFLFEKDGFKFVPVDRTYRFMKKASNQILTAEEAEAQMKKRNALPRWVYKDSPAGLGSGGEGGSGSVGGGSGSGGSRLFTVRQSMDRAGDAVNEDLDYDDNELFEDDEENPLLEGDEEANKAIEERVRREMLSARNFESKEDELEDMDDLFRTKKVTKEGRRTKRYLKKLEGKGDYESEDEDENPYATEEETDSEAESLSKKNEEAKPKVPSTSGTKPSSPSATGLEPNKSLTPGVSPGPSGVAKKTTATKKEKDRTTPQKPRHSKKEGSTSTAGGGLTPNKAPSSRRPSPKPPSRQSSPKPLAHGSRAGSPLAQTPVSAEPATPPSSAMTGLEGPGAAAVQPSSRPSLIVRLQISAAGRKRLREEETSQSTVKRIKFNLTSGGKALSPSPSPDEGRPSLSQVPSAEPSPAATSSPGDYLITEEEIVSLIRGERLTTKQLLAKLKGKLKRNENNRAIVGGILKKRCRIVEGFLVFRD